MPKSGEQWAGQWSHVALSSMDMEMGMEVKQRDRCLRPDGLGSIHACIVKVQALLSIDTTWVDRGLNEERAGESEGEKQRGRA